MEIVEKYMTIFDAFVKELKDRYEDELTDGSIAKLCVQLTCNVFDNLDVEINNNNSECTNSECAK